MSYSTLVKNAGGDFTRTDKWGDKQHFDADGFLTSIQALNNTNASATFHYDGSDRLSKIVDEFGREFTFTYDSTSGKLESVNDFFGRDSELIHTGNELTSITVADEVETGYTAPEWSFEYTTIGGKKYLNKVTNRLLKRQSMFTTLRPEGFKRSNADHTTQNPSKWKLSPTISQGYAAGTGNTLLKTADVNARYIDEESNEFKFTTDRFGNVTSRTDALGNTTTYEYDDQNLNYRITQPDPDGAGSLAAPVTESGIRLLATSSLRRILMIRQRRQRITRLTTISSRIPMNLGILSPTKLDSDGTKVHEIERTFDALDRLTSVDDSFATYTYTLDNIGRITQKTESISGFSDQITMDYGYDKNGNRTSLEVIFGFGMFASGDYQNSYTFDGLNRMIEIQQEDQGGNAVADKLIKFQYDAMGQFEYVHRYENTTATDPSLRTIFTYDAAGQLTTLIHRDVQGIGQQTLLADYSFTFDDAGRLTQTDSSQDGVSSSE